MSISLRICASLTTLLVNGNTNFRTKRIGYGISEVSYGFTIKKFQNKLSNLHVYVNALRNLVEKFERTGIAYMLSRKEKMIHNEDAVTILSRRSIPK